MRLALCAFLGLMLLSSTSRAAEQHETGQSLTVPQLPAAPPIDASLGGAWKAAAVFHLTHEATYRKTASEDTVVRIGMYGGAMYVAFRAQQREPLVATQVTDGTGVLTGDAVMVHLWPNGLSGFAYWFATNLYGARDQYSSENSAYAPAWTAYGHRTSGGYIAILKIPLSAMHVQKGASWRAQFHRIVAASNSNYVWELDPQQSAFIDGRYGGRVLGLSSSTAAARPRLQMYGLGGFSSAASGGSTSRSGADFSLPVTATTSIFGTVHPDFSNVEIDQQSISPTEFSRRFSEVRPFFTQAAANFNQQTDLNSPMSTLYTPAIPTFRDGYGVEGRQGTVAFGAFNASGYARDDNAVALSASDESQRLTFTFQRVGVNAGSGNGGFHDLVDEEGFSFLNPRGHLMFFVNNATESGTAVTNAADARYQDIGGMYSTATAMIGAALQKMGPQFSPADGYVNQPPGEPGIAGYTLYASKQINFSPTARILDVAFSADVDRYHGPAGGINQADFTDQIRIDFKNQITLTAMQGISSLQTCVPASHTACDEQFLPYNGAGLSLGYALNTAHSSSISYMTGKYYHGHLDSWLRTLAIPLSKHAALTLEADDNAYTSMLKGEADSKQWLDRVSLSYQFNSAVSADFGARRILGANQPFAFAPYGVGPTSAPLPVDATNLTAALHFFRGSNEVYIVYGDPNRLVTVPTLFVKLIRYVGAGKGT
jgi:hypothetical protein